MADADAPALTDAEIERIGNSLVPPDLPSAPPRDPFDRRLLLLAVSGGVDSMALMHIVAKSVGAMRRAHILVATVDHALRAESAEEARFVHAEAARIGLEHVTLVWQGSKPATGIQEGARAARYQLLANVYHDQLFPEKTLVTAHTLDDQAETV